MSSEQYLSAEETLICYKRINFMHSKKLLFKHQINFISCTRIFFSSLQKLSFLRTEYFYSHKESLYLLHRIFFLHCRITLISYAESSSFTAQNHYSARNISSICCTAEHSWSSKNRALRAYIKGKSLSLKGKTGLYLWENIE